MTTERKRDGGITPPAWWLTEADRAKRQRGTVNERIAVDVARALDVASVDVSRVTRCLNGSSSTIPMLVAISGVLGVPPPVAIAQTQGEAMAIEAALAVERRRSLLAAADVKIATFGDEVRELTKRQRGRVDSTNGGPERRVVGGVGNRRRHTRPS